MTTKKRCRKSRTSRGIVGSPTKARTSVGCKRVLNQQAAWAAGKRVMLTVANTDKERGGPFIKVEAREVWGVPPFVRKVVA